MAINYGARRLTTLVICIYLFCTAFASYGHRRPLKGHHSSIGRPFKDHSSSQSHPYNGHSKGQNRGSPQSNGSSSNQTISSNQTSQNIDSFVERDGTRLVLNGESYRIAGPNIYWLALDENSPEATSGNPKPPSKQRVNEAMEIAVAMGANTIRSISLGVSTGKSVTIHPSLNEYDDSNFEPLDYAVYAAAQFGLRLIIPLTDNYQYYAGGKYDFLKFRGVSTDDNGNIFYTNQQVISDFKKYISNILNHKNQYTGRLLNEEPAILAWQIGNELGGWRQNTGWPPQSFVQTIASYIKSIAPKQLVASCEGSHWDSTSGAIAPSYTVDDVDIIDEHSYPIDGTVLKKTLQLANQHSKAYLSGETDWTHDGETITISEFIDTLTEDGHAGSMVWSVFGHDSECNEFVRHNDGYSIYCSPNGNTESQQARIYQFVSQFYELTNQNVPASLPQNQCKQESLL